MIAFFLGREPALSIAEIFAVFPRAKGHVYLDRAGVLLVEDIDPADAAALFPRMGGVVKVAEIVGEGAHREDFKHFVINALREIPSESKLPFAIGSTPTTFFKPFDDGLKIKKVLQDEGRSLRLVNKENANINSAVFKKEKLGRNRTEFHAILRDERILFARTLTFQDVDAYTRRDMSKERDMEVGMLPPKLAQMMLNFAGPALSIYDPFVGLGTILIEAAATGAYDSLFGSDLSEKMVATAESNVKGYVSAQRLENPPHVRCIVHDSTQLASSDLHLNAKTVIVTEGYLGDNFTPKSISEEKIERQQERLMRLHRGFFGSLKTMNVRGNIVVCFPYWDLHGKYIYLDIITELKQMGFEQVPFYPRDFSRLASRRGTLLYRRPGQIVGREITCWRRK